MRGVADMWADHVAGHLAWRAEEQRLQALAASDPCDEVDHERIRPPEPRGHLEVWYRGWEVGYSHESAYWGGQGWIAYKGGCDLDAPCVYGATYAMCLDEVDEQEDE